ncbi:flagellar motor protein MotB [Megalodesulfovibrio paquesii]
MSPSKPSSLILIKRVKKGGHGHHGGSWKVAYADFVTAMMALFLLMWLLLALNANQKEQISSVFRGERPKWVEDGKGGAALTSGSETAAAAAAKNLPMVQVALGIKELVEQDPELQKVSGISSDDAGVYLHVDAPALFEDGATRLTPLARQTLERIATFLRSHNISLAVRGHASKTEPSAPFASHWELSAARAATCTDFLSQQGGVDPQRLVASAYSDNRPLVPETADNATRKNARVDFYYFAHDVPGQ